VAASKKHKVMILGTVALILAVIIGSFLYLYSQNPFAGNAEPLTLGMVAHEYNSLIYIANDQGYFKANGLNLTIRNYSSGLETLNALLSGQSDISTAFDFVFVNGAMQNASIFSIGSVSKSLILYVIARTDRGISMVSDLKGKIIGLALGTSEEFYLGRFLQINGLNPSEVTYRNLPFAEHPTALANGTVDAAITFQPYVSQINDLLGNNIVVWPAQADQFQFAEAICTRAWALAHQDLIVQFLRALVQAEDSTINHQDQAMVMVARDLNYTSLYMASVWQNYQFSVDQTFILLIQDEARWLMSNNSTSATAVPNFMNYVYTSGLKSVRPESVNIIG
jgi:NitT/TauT family transport system substrate-binding protein